MAPTTNTCNAFLCLFLTCCVKLSASQPVSGGPDPEDVDACFAKATAVTDPKNAVGNALANSVAQATSKTLQCGEDSQSSPSDISGLSVAVALAISQTRDADVTCAAEVDADAQEEPKRVANRVTDSLATGLLDQLEGELGAWCYCLA